MLKVSKNGGNSVVHKVVDRLPTWNTSPLITDVEPNGVGITGKRRRAGRENRTLSRAKREAKIDAWCFIS
jgi:hypothetical protein